MVKPPLWMNQLVRIAVPAMALAASFFPWITVGVVTTTRHWNAYQVTPLALAWLILDVSALALSIRALSHPAPTVLTTAWVLFGAASLGGAASAFVMVAVSRHVSHILSAPNPIKLAWGLKGFAAVAFVWTASAFMPWPLNRSDANTRGN